MFTGVAVRGFGAGRQNSKHVLVKSYHAVRKVPTRPCEGNEARYRPPPPGHARGRRDDGEQPADADAGAGVYGPGYALGFSFGGFGVHKVKGTRLVHDRAGRVWVVGGVGVRVGGS